MKKNIKMPDLSALDNTSAALGNRKVISSESEFVESSTKVYEIPIENLLDNPKNGRRTYKEEEIELMANAIRDVGFRGNVEVVKSQDQLDKFVLIFGHKRKRACILAGLKTMPCVIISEEGESTRKTSFYENFIRSNISKVEQALELEALKEDFEDITNVELAKITGMSESDISRLFKILELPLIVQDFIDSGELSYSHAKYLFSIKDENLLIQLAKDCVVNGWSLKEFSKKIKNNTEGEGRESKKDADAFLARVSHAEEHAISLSQKFKSEVLIKPANKGGKIVLPYNSDQELIRLIEMLEG